MMRWIAAAAVVLSVLAITGGWALAQINPKQSGLAAAIAGTGAAVIFTVLACWGVRKRLETGGDPGHDGPEGTP